MQSFIEQIVWPQNESFFFKYMRDGSVLVSMSIPFPRNHSPRTSSHHLAQLERPHGRPGEDCNELSGDISTSLAVLPAHYSSQHRWHTILPQRYRKRKGIVEKRVPQCTMQQKTENQGSLCPSWDKHTHTHAQTIMCKNRKLYMHAAYSKDSKPTEKLFYHEWLALAHLSTSSFSCSSPDFRFPFVITLSCLVVCFDRYDRVSFIFTDRQSFSIRCFLLQSRWPRFPLVSEREGHVMPDSPFYTSFPARSLGSEITGVLPISIMDLVIFSQL